MIVNILCYFVVPVAILALYVLLMIVQTTNAIKDDLEDDEL